MDYKSRVYDVYVSAHWQHFHASTVQEYEAVRRTYRGRFLPFLPKDKNANIIDIACGAGHFLYFLQKEGYHCSRGIDISQQAIAIAQSMGVHNAAVGDLFEVLPHHKGEFQHVSANDIIEHLKKDTTLDFLDLVYNSLEPGGTVSMTTDNAGSLLGGRGVFMDFTHETGFTVESLRQVLGVAGFENIAVYGETPVVHSLGSAVRAMLWGLVKALIKGYLLIDGSTGLGMWKRELVLEPRMFAVGRKPCD